MLHLVKEWVITFFDEMNSMFLGPSPDFGHLCETWKEWGDDADKAEIKLRRGIETMGQKFVYDFVMDIRYRIISFSAVLGIMECV